MHIVRGEGRVGQSGRLGLTYIHYHFPIVMHGCESWTIKKAEHQEELMLLSCGAGEDS